MFNHDLMVSFMQYIEHVFSILDWLIFIHLEESVSVSNDFH